MSLSLGLGLTLGNPVLNGGKPAHTPTVRENLVSAISGFKFVTVTYEGELLTFAPLVIYELDGVAYVDGFLSEDTGHGNRPPALTALVEADIGHAHLTADTFSVHPRLWAILGRYENVQSIVQRVQQPA